MKLDPDLVKIVQHGSVYVVLLLILKILYIDPVLRLLKKRESLTLGRAEKSKELATELQQMKEAYHAKISLLREEIEGSRAERLKALRAQTEERIKRTKKENEAKLTQLRKELDRELNSLRQNLSEHSSEVQKEILKVVLEGKVVRA